MNSRGGLPDLAVVQAELERMRLLADNVPVAIAYFESADNRCLFANEGYARIFGHASASELLGRQVVDIIGEQANAQIQPHVRIALEEHRSAAYERELQDADGSRRVIEVNLVPHLQGGRAIGAFVLIADITRHREAERALRESEERLARFMHASAEGIVFHRDGFITDANPPLLALLGLRLEDMRGRPTLDFIAPDQQARAREVMLSGAEISYDSVVLHRDGSRIPVECRVRTLERDGVRLRMALLRDQRAQLAAQARIRHLAEHDALTGLANRSSFMQRLQQRLAAPGAEGLALLFVDLDHFKRVNDSLGHLAGDRLLCTVAQRIGAALGAGDEVARFGGDEFLVLLGSARSHDEVAALAQRLLAAVQAEVEIGGVAISVTPSIGVACHPGDGGDADTLLQHADTAMYAAKLTGRAAVRFFEPGMAQHAWDDLQTESRLAQALRADGFELHFQPVRRLPAGELCAVEALLRWRDPKLGLVEPGQFLAVAQAQRLMGPIGRIALRRALDAARGWQRAGRPPVPVLVHVSAAEFQAPDFVASVQQALQEAGVAGALLELELTEQLLSDDLGSALQTLRRLRALGVRIAIDDFGAGHGSLACLRRLPLDRLKLDRGFVTELPGDAVAQAVALALLQLAQALAIEVIAEGVETAAQRDWLIAHGCPVMQGRLIAPPQPLAALAL